MHQLTLVNGGTLFTPTQQIAHCVLHITLFASQTLSGKRINRVTFPATWVVTSNHAMIVGARVIHQNLSAIKQLRNTPNGKQKTERHLGQGHILLEPGVHAIHIVIVTQHHEIVGIWVLKIIR